MIISCPLCGGFHLLAVDQNYPVKITFFFFFTEKNINYDYLFIIDKQLVSYGIEIVKLRNKFVNDINTILSDIYISLGGIEGLNIKYKNDYSDKSVEEILEVYKNNINRDINLGSTHFGIHRDDSINGEKSIELYKEFVENQDEKLLDTILLHNYDDIYNLSKLINIHDLVKEKLNLLERIQE